MMPTKPNTAPLSASERFLLRTQLSVNAWLLRMAYKRHSINTAQQIDYPSAQLAVFKTGFSVHDLNQTPDFLIQQDQGSYSLYQYVYECGDHCLVVFEDDPKIVQTLLRRMWEYARAMVHDRMGVIVDTQGNLVVRHPNK